MIIQGKGHFMENYLDELGLDFGDNDEIIYSARNT